MSWFIPDVIKEVARNLRKNMTESESVLWEELKSRKMKYKFLRQKPIYLYTEDSWLDKYVIPDFCSLELKLIIEVDWSIHDLENIYLLDLEKEKLLIQKWFKVLRIKNSEIKSNLSLILDKIQDFILTHPQPLP